MASISIINNSKLENNRRIEPEFYRSEYLRIDSVISSLNYKKLPYYINRPC